MVKALYSATALAANSPCDVLNETLVLDWQNIGTDGKPYARHETVVPPLQHGENGGGPDAYTKLAAKYQQVLEKGAAE